MQSDAKNDLFTIFISVPEMMCWFIKSMNNEELDVKTASKNLQA